MPRPLRIEFENAWYHVMNRGAGRQVIYKRSKHRHMFLNALEEATELFGAEIHAYCLMDNHYHLLIKTPRANLSRVMRHINGVYTQRYNRDTGLDGPLFRGRYKAILITGDPYLLQVSRYIHLNPLNAKIVKNLKEYSWSSYSSYLKPKNKPHWLQTNELLLMCSKNQSSNVYKKFVELGVDNETKKFYERGNYPVIFGIKNAKENILKNLPHKKIKSSHTDYKRTRVLPTLDQVNEACGMYFKLNSRELLEGKRGKENLPRKIAIYGCRVWASGKLEEIATKYRCQTHTLVSNVVKNIKNQITSNKKIFKIVEEIRELVITSNKESQINN